MRPASKWIGIVLIAASAWVYLFSPKEYHVPLSIRLSQTSLPIVEATIDGNSFSLGIHLGSKFDLELPCSSLKTIAKMPSEHGSFLDIQGNQHEYPQYLLDKILIGSLSLSQLKVLEHPDDPSFVIGNIGRPLLSRLNLLFDIEHFLIIASNSPRKLKQDGYDLSTFKKIPLEITPKGIYVKVETDFGVHRLYINTGSSITAIKSDQSGHTNTEKFMIQGYNLGPTKIHFVKISDKLEGLDGFIGMDFFKKYTIYINFHKKLMHIRTAES